MSMKIEKVEGWDDLYCHYDGQYDAQECYIEIDCDAEIVSAAYNSEIGNAVPASTWHGHQQRIGIPCLTADAANALLAEILPLANRVLTGYESEWDGNNHVARYNDDAVAATADIEQMCDDQNFGKKDLILAYDASECLDCYIHTDTSITIDNDVVTAATTDTQIRVIADRIEEDSEGDNTVIRGLYETLIDRRDALTEEAADEIGYWLVGDTAAACTLLSGNYDSGEEAARAYGVDPTMVVLARNAQNACNKRSY